MPGSESTMGWSDDIDSIARVLMNEASKEIYAWCTAIIERDEKVIEGIDEKINAFRKEIDKQRKIAIGYRDRLEEFDRKIMKAQKEHRDLINNEIPSVISVANKYQIESERLKEMKKDSKEYKDQLARLKSFEPKYKKWLSLTEAAEKKLDEIYRLIDEKEALDKEYRRLWPSKNYSLLQQVEISMEPALREMIRTKTLLENAYTKNLLKNRKKLVDAFHDRKYIDSVSGMIYNTIKTVTRGAWSTEEFPDDAKIWFLDVLSKNIYFSDLKEFNFLRELAENPKNYSVAEIDGKKQKVFDMDKITTNDLMAVFNGFFKSKIRMAVQNTLKAYKDKRSLFIQDVTKNEDGDEDSLIDNVIPVEEESMDAKGKHDRERERRNKEKLMAEEVQESWKRLSKFIIDSVDSIADTANKSLMRQLPENSYFKKIGQAKSKEILKKAFQQIIRVWSGDLRNGRVTIPKDLRNYVRTAIGGVESGENFNIIYTIIRASLEYYLSSFLYQDVFESIKNMKDESEDMYSFGFLHQLERRKDESKQALRDYSMVKYASRTHKIAIAIISDDDFELPEEAFKKLIKASTNMEKKVDFLLEDKSIPDGSGKYNQKVIKTPIRNVGDYGA